MSLIEAESSSDVTSAANSMFKRATDQSGGLFDQVSPHLLSCHRLRWHRNLDRAGNTVVDRQIGHMELEAGRDPEHAHKYLKHVWQPP